MSKIDNNKIKISGLEYLYDNGNLSNSDTLRKIDTAAVVYWQRLVKILLRFCCPLESNIDTWIKMIFYALSDAMFSVYALSHVLSEED